ncbi:hypothetical protein [Micromonospora gifhornensis]|nr:hypothetical protein [Micromonospora gifhornensis]
MARTGAHVVVTARAEEAAVRTADELRGGRAVCIRPSTPPGGSDSRE